MTGDDRDTMEYSSGEPSGGLARCERDDESNEQREEIGPTTGATSP